MDMVVKKNPDVQFDWYVELQHRADWADLFAHHGNGVDRVEQLVLLRREALGGESRQHGAHLGGGRAALPRRVRRLGHLPCGALPRQDGRVLGMSRVC